MVILVVVDLAKVLFYLILDCEVNLLLSRTLDSVGNQVCMARIVLALLLAGEEHLMDDAPFWKLPNVYIKDILARC